MSEIIKLAEAIENYNDGDLCLGTLISLKKIKDKAKALETELVEALAEIESLKLTAGELNGAFNARPKCEKCKDKDKLIEQMRDEILEAAHEWSLYVEVDTAPRSLVEHLKNKFKEILK